jgi:hypothetical protein
LPFVVRDETYTLPTCGKGEGGTGGKHRADVKIYRPRVCTHAPYCRLGLRGSQHDVQLAVESIERMRTERRQIRQKEQEDRERESLRR